MDKYIDRYLGRICYDDCIEHGADKAYDKY